MRLYLTTGRIVRYVLAEEDLPDDRAQFAGETIPAMVVGISELGPLNLTGFPDPTMTGLPPFLVLPNKVTAWPPEVGKWHWPPQFMEQQALEKKAKKEAYKAKAKAAAAKANPVNSD